MDAELSAKLEAQEKKIDAIYTSVEKTRKYFLVVMWISIIAVVLPALGLVFAIPAFLDSYTSSFGGVL